MTYGERVATLQAAILEALAACKPRIEAAGKHPVGRSRLNAIAAELVPFERVFRLHFRSDDEPRTERYAEWRFACLYSNRDGRHDGLLARLEAEWHEALARDQGAVYMLTFDTAVADALMSEEVLAFLQGCAMARYAAVTGLGNSSFDFVMLDPDGAVHANYCDIVRWKRSIDRAALEWRAGEG